MVTGQSDAPWAGVTFPGRRLGEPARASLRGIIVQVDLSSVTWHEYLFFTSALPLVSCMTLVKSRPLCGPQFPQL